MWLFDFPTLLIVLAASLYLGLWGIMGYPIVMFDDDTMRALYLASGISGMWQLTRQRFW
jgi:hypothetical protein